MASKSSTSVDVPTRSSSMASDMTWPHLEDPLRLKPSEHKGIFTTRRIAAGTLVLREKPIIQFASIVSANRKSSEEEITEHVNSTATMLQGFSTAERGNIRLLSRPGRKIANDLRSKFRAVVDEQTVDNELLSLIIILDYNSWDKNVFANMNRFNHSCVPNLHLDYIEDDLCAYTMRDIEDGEELFASYLPGMGMKAERQRLLSRRYNFDCTCEACNESQVEYHETTRTEIAGLRDHLQTFIKAGPVSPDFAGDEEDALRVLDDCQRLVQLCIEVKGFGMPYLVDAYQYLANIYRRANNSKAASDAAGQAYLCARIIYGPNDPRAYEYLIAAGQLENLTMMKIACLDSDEDWKKRKEGEPSWMERHWMSSEPGPDTATGNNAGTYDEDTEETNKAHETEEQVAVEA